jgi:small ligand-binding sensory domain FIST
VGLQLPDSDRAGYGTYLVRSPMGLEKSTGSLFFAGGGFADGTRIMMTRRSPEQIRNSAAATGRAVAARHPGRDPLLVLQFDCAGRGQILFGADAAVHTIAPMRAAFGTDVPWIGLHTHGEIAAIGTRTQYHNYTVVLCALYASDPR